MRISFFSPHIADGGVTRSTGNLAVELLKQGHKPVFLTIRPQASTVHRFRERGLDVIDLGASRTALALPALARHIRAERPEALICIQHYANVMSVLARGISRTRTKLILTERLRLAQALAQDPPHKRLVLKHMMRLLYKRADAVVTLSMADAQELRLFLGADHASNNVHAIYNPFPVAEIRKAATEFMPDHQWLRPRRSEFTVVSMGRLHPQKDFPTLIEAAAAARAQIPQLRLLIYGDGAERANLQRLISRMNLESIVQILPFLSNPFPYMKNANLYVCSSQYEGLPNSLIEAQICGIPVITTRCSGGAEEAVLAGKAGGLVPVHEPRALADEIVRLHGDPERVGVILKEAAANLERFDPSKVCQRYLELIQA